MQLTYLLKLINKYKLIFFIICGLTVLTALIFTSFQKPQYKVRTQWLLEKMELKKASVPQGGDKTSIVNLTKYTRGNTFIEAEILNSWPVIAKLHKLAKVPYGLYTFKTNIAVFGEYKPYITIRFFSNSIEEINNVLEASKTVFMDNLITSKVQYHSKNSGFLEKISNEAREENIKIKNKLQKAEYKYNTLDPISVGISVQSNLKDFIHTINDIKHQIQSQEESFKSYLRKLKAHNIQEVINKANLTSNFIIMETIEDINKEKIENIKLKSKYTSKHKTVIESEKRLEELNKELLMYYRAALGKHITAKQIKSLNPYTPIQLNIAIEAINIHTNLKADKERLVIFEKLLEVEKAKIKKASETKYELSYLNAVSDFNEKKLKLIEDLRLKESLNMGFAENNYLQMTLKEPFIKQIKPTYIANMFYALGLGLLLSIFTVLAIETLNPNINTTDYITSNNVKILSLLSNTKDLIHSFHQNTESIKEYTSLKLMLSLLKTNNKRNIFTILPSTEDNSNSIVLTNLAISLARTGEKVLLIDLDFDEPQIGKFFEIKDKSTSLNSYFTQQNVSPEDLLVTSEEFSNLDIVICQQLKQLQKESIYYSDSLKTLFKSYSSKYDHIIVNISNVQALPYINLIDQTCLLVKINRTKKDRFKLIQEYLNSNNIELNGCLVDTSEDIIS